MGIKHILILVLTLSTACAEPGSGGGGSKAKKSVKGSTPNTSSPATEEYSQAGTLSLDLTGARALAVVGGPAGVADSAGGGGAEGTKQGDVNVAALVEESKSNLMKMTAEGDLLPAYVGDVELKVMKMWVKKDLIVLLLDMNSPVTVPLPDDEKMTRANRKCNLLYAKKSDTTLRCVDYGPEAEKNQPGFFPTPTNVPNTVQIDGSRIVYAMAPLGVKVFDTVSNKADLVTKQETTVPPPFRALAGEIFYVKGGNDDLYSWKNGKATKVDEKVTGPYALSSSEVFYYKADRNASRPTRRYYNAKTQEEMFSEVVTRELSLTTTDAPSYNVWGSPNDYVLVGDQSIGLGTTGQEALITHYNGEHKQVALPDIAPAWDMQTKMLAYKNDVHTTMPLGNRHVFDANGSDTLVIAGSGSDKVSKLVAYNVDTGDSNEVLTGITTLALSAFGEDVYFTGLRGGSYEDAHSSALVDGENEIVVGKVNIKTGQNTTKSSTSSISEIQAL